MCVAAVSSSSWRPERFVFGDVCVFCIWMCQNAVQVQQFQLDADVDIARAVTEASRLRAIARREVCIDLYFMCAFSYVWYCVSAQDSRAASGVRIDWTGLYFQFGLLCIGYCAAGCRTMGRFGIPGSGLSECYVWHRMLYQDFVGCSQSRSQSQPEPPVPQSPGFDRVEAPAVCTCMGVHVSCVVCVLHRMLFPVGTCTPAAVSPDWIGLHFACGLLYIGYCVAGWLRRGAVWFAGWALSLCCVWHRMLCQDSGRSSQRQSQSQPGPLASHSPGVGSVDAPVGCTCMGVVVPCVVCVFYIGCCCRLVLVWVLLLVAEPEPVPARPAAVAVAGLRSRCTGGLYLYGCWCSVCRVCVLHRKG